MILFQSHSVSKDLYDELVAKHRNSILNIKEQALSVSHDLQATAKKAEESLR